MAELTPDPGWSSRPDRGEIVIPRWVWVLGFVSGVVVVTVLRPVLRHIPELPPDLGALGALEVVDGSGEPAPSPGGAGTVEVVALQVDPALASRNGVALRKLSYVFASLGERSPRIVAVWPSIGDDAAKGARVGAMGEPHGVEHIGAGAVDLERLASGVRSWPGCSSAGGSLLLVDAGGHVRGCYSTSSLEVVSEVYHRSSHVRDGTVRVR